MDNRTVFAGWNYVIEETPEGPVRKKLGEGGYGNVFEIEKEGEIDFKSAMKVISIPNEQRVVNEYIAEGMNRGQILQILEEEKAKAEDEIKWQIEGRNTPNIVRIEDYEVREKENDIGWDIFIRMELLAPISKMQAGSLTPETVRQLGIDICNALEQCHSIGMLHRDIKPGNIFADKKGNFKLGDFGISRILGKTSGIVSKTATQKYAAPEVIRVQKQKATSDIYSLGLVMYELLNQGRLPFLPPAKEPIRLSDRDEALQKRLNGERIKPIEGVPGDLNQVMIKACAFDPKDRFSSAEEMRDALISGHMSLKEKVQPFSYFRNRNKSLAIICASIVVLILGITAIVSCSDDDVQENSIAEKNQATERTTTESQISTPVIASEVSNFPAYAGDTITVSSADEFQKLFADGNLKEGTVIELDSGEYHLDGSLAIADSNIKIKGMGSTKPVINGQIVTMSRGVMLEDVCFYITKRSQTDEGNSGIRFQEAGYMKNVDINMEYSSDQVIYGVAAYGSVKMEGCSVDVDHGQNGNIALELGDDFSVNNCTIKSNDLGIEFLGIIGESVTDEEIEGLINNNEIQAPTKVERY